MPSLSHFLEVLVKSAPLFLKAAVLTLQITATAVVVGVLCGLVFALIKVGSPRRFGFLTDLYVHLVRGTPLIVQIFVLYFGMTRIIHLPSFLAASLALGLHNGAYMAEIFRGAVQSVPRGQFEASKALGLSTAISYRKVIMPQALRLALPPLGNQFIIALKDSSLAAFISMNELFNVATTLGSNHFDQMTYLLVVAVYYLILVVALGLMFSALERRLSRSRA